MSTLKTLRSSWSMAVQSLTRPYRVSLPMIALMSLVPFYIFIADVIRERPLHVPALPLDRVLPLQPTWSLVYGALYFVLIVLPVFIVREEVQLRRTMLAYLTVWITAYACFLLYPTAAPRPREIAGDGFAVWGLRFLYSADPPYNCFPSLHVAHSVVSALACYRVHRKVGLLALVCASLVALSTLFTKQHYVLDVAAGLLLGGLAGMLFLRGARRTEVSDIDHRLAPIFAVGAIGIAAIVIGILWIPYRLNVLR